MTAPKLAPQKAGDVAFEHCGLAQRWAIKLALRAHAAGEVTAFALLALHAVFDRTVSYSKLVDRTSARQLAGIVYDCVPELLDRGGEGSGRRRRVRDAVAALARVGVIQFVGARGGANAGLVVCVPPRDSDGNVLPMEHVLSRRHVGKSGQRAPGETRAPTMPPTCSDESTQRVPAGDQHLGTTEEPSEGVARDPARSLLDGLAKNGPTPSLEEVEGVIARARGHGLDGVALLRLIDTAITGGDAYPSDVRKRVDATAKPTPLDSDRVTRAAGEPRRCPRCSGTRNVVVDREVVPCPACRPASSGDDAYFDGLRDHIGSDDAEPAA